MAVETHNVVVTEEEAGDDDVAVMAFWPRGGVGITASSDGINHRQIGKLIKRAAGRLNSRMDKHGIDPAALEEDATETIQDGIINYAISRGLRKLGKFEEAQDYADDWDAVYELLDQKWSNLGDAVPVASQIKSNINTTAPTTPKWKSGKFTGF